MMDDDLFLVCIEMPGSRHVVMTSTHKAYKGQLWFKTYNYKRGEGHVYCRYPRYLSDKQIRDLVHDYFCVQSG